MSESDALFEPSATQKKITDMRPEELLQLTSINGIFMDTLNTSLLPFKSYILYLMRDEFNPIKVDPELLERCQADNFQTRIHAGLIGMDDYLPEVLAYQRAFIDEILNVEKPHDLIAKELGDFIDEVNKVEDGYGIVYFKGRKMNKKLLVMRKTYPSYAISPFGDRVGSNVDLRVYDVTGVHTVNDRVLSKAEEKGKVLLLSGMTLPFIERYGFYEEKDPRLIIEMEFFGKVESMNLGNRYNFLPEGLHMLGISNLPLDILRSKYSSYQLRYKGTTKRAN